MLAFSVREALREAIAAFGPAGHSVDLASPATPEAVFWAIDDARRAAEDADAAEPGSVAPPTDRMAGRGGATADAERRLVPFER
jgi:xanthine dehydrogenase large subunit